MHTSKWPIFYICNHKLWDFTTAAFLFSSLASQQPWGWLARVNVPPLHSVVKIYFWMPLHHFSLIAVPFILFSMLPKPIRCLFTHKDQMNSDCSQWAQQRFEKVTIFSGNCHHYLFCVHVHGWTLPIHVGWMSLILSVLAASRENSQYCMTS